MTDEFETRALAGKRPSEQNALEGKDGKDGSWRARLVRIAYLVQPIDNMANNSVVRQLAAKAGSDRCHSGRRRHDAHVSDRRLPLSHHVLVLVEVALVEERQCLVVEHGRVDVEHLLDLLELQLLHMLLARIERLARLEHVHPVAPELGRHESVGELAVLGHLEREVEHLADDLVAYVVVLLVLGLGALRRDQVVELLVLLGLLDVLEFGKSCKFLFAFCLFVKFIRLGK